MSDKYYDAIAAGYNTLHGAEQLQKYRIIASLLQLEQNARVLDVGAGTGIGNAIFPGMVGIDPSPGLLAQHPNKNSSVASAEQIPYPDKSFDAVLCVSAFHHTNPKQALREMQRVTRGAIAITILKKSPQHDSLLALLQETFPSLRCVDETKDTICVFTPSHEKIK